MAIERSDVILAFGAERIGALRRVDRDAQPRNSGEKERGARQDAQPDSFDVPHDIVDVTPPTASGAPLHLPKPPPTLPAAPEAERHLDIQV
jgi:hypothetical protein